MWLTHFWHSWSQFFIFAWDVTAGGILRTGVLICLVDITVCCECFIGKIEQNDNNYPIVKYKSFFITQTSESMLPHQWMSFHDDQLSIDLHVLLAGRSLMLIISGCLCHYNAYWCPFCWYYYSISHQMCTRFCLPCCGLINALLPGSCGSAIFKLTTQNSSVSTRCEIALGWMPHNYTY